MFSFFRKRNKPSELSGGDPLFEKIDGKELAYVTERLPDEFGSVTERVLGKVGRINAHDGVINVMCNGKDVFTCDSDTAECGELMSLAGVIVKGIDRESGQRRTIVAYYQYYRK